MHISRLEIKNFRNFGDPAFVVDLKPFTVLLGENNIGKSNLLSAVSLLFGQELSALQRRVLETDDFNYDAVAAFKRHVANEEVRVEHVAFPEIIIEATLDSLTEEQHPVVGDWYSNTQLTQARVTYRFSLRTTFDSAKWIADQRSMLREQNLAEQMRHKELPSQDAVPVDHSHLVELPIEEYRYVIYGGGRPSNECEAYLLKMLRAEVLDALRDAERELVDGGEYRLLYRVLRQNRESRYTDVKRLLSDLKQAIDVDPALKAIKTDVESLLRLVSLETVGESHAIGLSFASPEAADLLKRIGMTYGANPMTVARNGLGRNNLLYIALLLSQLSKAPDSLGSEDAYVCFRFVGIEEPEAHLHPHLQDHLARNIEGVRQQHSDRLQLILTSHSTHIAAKLDLKNTAILFRSDSDGRLVAHYVLDGLDDQKDKASIRFLSLYLDATKSEMLFARRLILVEGIAEQTVIPLMFEQQVGKSLQSVGGTVLNVNGVAFRHFLSVVRHGFFKKCVVLTDSDSGTPAENRADKLEADFADVAHIRVEKSGASTFEKDLISANNTGDGRDLLFAALTFTKPTNGPKFQLKTANAPIDVESFFAEIVDYKAEFAFSLATVLRGEAEDAFKEQRQPRSLNIPPYIANAFTFLEE